jgi:hypothetical protein
MADEIATEQPATGAPANTTTIIRETRSSSGTGIIMAVILLIAVVGGIYLFSQTTASESVKDNAVAEAANNVGTAATKVGDAAQDAVSTSK